jgi:hypothetical protein
MMVEGEMPYKLEVKKDLFYDLREINQITNIPIATLEHWCRKTKLRSYKPGRSFIVKGEWLFDLFDGKFFNQKLNSKKTIAKKNDLMSHNKKISNKVKLYKTIFEMKKRGLTISDLK